MKLFVFGTLRVGEGNYRVIQAAVKKSYTEATTSGRMYIAAYRWKGRVIEAGYPCVRFSEPGVIVGDLLDVDPEHRSTYETFRMEIGAGYIAKEIKVYLERINKTVTAIGFDWPEEEACGPRVTTGNWKSKDRIATKQQPTT